MKKLYNIIYVSVFACLIFALSAFCILKPETEFSESERRYLATAPELSPKTLSNGEFMLYFDGYATDQFPLREQFRTLKAVFATKVFGKLENNNIYTQNGHISKIEYPESPEKTEAAKEKLADIYTKYLKNTACNVYLSVIPDKHYFLAPEKGYLSIDYPKFIERFRMYLPYMEYIDILPFLSADDYYFTDSHWKQEKLSDIVAHYGNQMGVNVSAKYQAKALDTPFMGVYAGQSALPTKGDILRYLTNETIENCTVTYYDNMGMPQSGKLYNMEKAQGKDPYEMFLSGAQALVILENPYAQTDRELVLFRDSFGSSIAPLFLEGYKKITLIDIRYIKSDFIGAFVPFEKQDVLFLYSTTLLNTSPF